MISGWYTDMNKPGRVVERETKEFTFARNQIHPVKNILPGARAESVKPEVRDANILPDARIGDADRTRYMTHINDLYANGYLTSEEHDARINLVFKTKTATELQFLIKDLPNFPAPARKPFRQTGYASAMVIFLGLALVIISGLMGYTNWGIIPFFAGGLMMFAGFYNWKL
jgi:hypothetical protein